MKKLIIVLLLFTSVLLVSVTVYAADLFVFDNAEVLSDSFESDLNEAIIDFKQNHNADLVILTTDTLDGRSPSYYADDFYDYNGFDQNGILLLISFEDNDVYISTSGNGINAFTDYGIDKALDEIVSELSYGDYETAIEKFLSIADEYYTLYEEGTPFDKGSVPLTSGQIILIIIVIWVVAFVISLIIVNNMKAQLTSIRARANANDYIQNGNINLINSSDIFLYRNVSRVRIPKDTGGSSTHRGSSGRIHGGGGRKF